MTIYSWEPKMIEKTWPINIGQQTRTKLEKIQARTKELAKFEPPFRALAERAIEEYYDRLFPPEPKDLLS